jgi:hypothetical protein
MATQVVAITRLDRLIAERTALEGNSERKESTLNAYESRHGWHRTPGKRIDKTIILSEQAIKSLQDQIEVLDGRILARRSIPCKHLLSFSSILIAKGISGQLSHLPPNMEVAARVALAVSLFLGHYMELPEKAGQIAIEKIRNLGLIGLNEKMDSLAELTFQNDSYINIGRWILPSLLNRDSIMSGIQGMFEQEAVEGIVPIPV